MTSNNLQTFSVFCHHIAATSKTAAEQCNLLTVSLPSAGTTEGLYVALSSSTAIRTASSLMHRMHRVYSY
jgi:hypothetical protein